MRPNLTAVRSSSAEGYPENDASTKPHLQRSCHQGRATVSRSPRTSPACGTSGTRCSSMSAGAGSRWSQSCATGRGLCQELSPGGRFEEAQPDSVMPSAAEGSPEDDESKRPHLTAFMSPRRVDSSMVPVGFASWRYIVDSVLEGALLAGFAPEPVLCSRLGFPPRTWQTSGPRASSQSTVSSSPCT